MHLNDPDLCAQVNLPVSHILMKIEHGTRKKMCTEIWGVRKNDKSIFNIATNIAITKRKNETEEQNG